MIKLCKLSLKIAGFLLAVGLIVLIFGFCNGGRSRDMQIRAPFSPFSTWRSHSETKNVSFSTGTITVDSAITALNFNVGYGDVTVVLGDEFSISCSDDSRMEQSFNNGILTLSHHSKRTLREVPRLIVTLPENVYDSVTFDVGMSSFTADGIACKIADISVGAGQMTLTNFTSSESSTLSVGMGQLNLDGTLTGQVDANVGMGQMDFDLTNPLEYGYEVGVGIGSIAIGDTSFTGIGNEGSHNSNAKTFYDLSCGMGTLNVNFT